MTVSVRLALVAVALCAGTALGQSTRREPHIGYVYPAGGKQGERCEVWLGGQFLYGPTDVFVSGEGVHASVIQHYRPLNNINKEQREALQKKMKEVRDKRLAERSGKAVRPATSKKTLVEKGATKKNAKKPKAAEKKSGLPLHPLLRNMDDKSLRELEHIRHELLNFRRRQRNAQIAETVVIEVTIDRNAAPGQRELRLRTRGGLTNPMCFDVGSLPEVCELESNDPRRRFKRPDDPPLEVPILLNGQIKPGDVDRFPIKARRGQPLVIETSARRLVPYLADAVPGWFQATVALYDASGKEVAYQDDYRFCPDPVLFYRIPKDGVYTVEIRDALYRGREDFVYRIAIGELPFITQMFPLGGREGSQIAASIAGWNLTRKRLPLKARPDPDGICQTALRQGKWLSNPVVYAVDQLPECMEAEPDDTRESAQNIVMPRIVNGRIDEPGDVDVFRFEGRAGDEVVAEVMARRLNSPLDSLLRITDASGKVLAWNDDEDDKGSGLITHHADSYVRIKLPKRGVYYACVTDSEGHGDGSYGYRLHIRPSQPDFALRMTPSSLSVTGGRAVPFDVHALRKDGFDGEIQLSLKDAPPGFRLDGGRIPKGRDHVRMTLTAPHMRLVKPIALKLEGRARIGGKTVNRPVVPADDMMQAFLYRHLVPAQQLMVDVRARGPGRSTVKLAEGGPVRIPKGGRAQVRVDAPNYPALRRVQLQLSDPPEGLTIQNVSVSPGGLALTLKADDKVHEGLADNLIVEVSAEVTNRQKGGKKAPKNRRASLGVLPAIPFEIVQR